MNKEQTNEIINLKEKFNNMIIKFKKIETKNYISNKFNGAGYVAILTDKNIAGQLEKNSSGKYILASYSTNGALQELEDMTNELVNSLNTAVASIKVVLL